MVSFFKNLFSRSSDNPAEHERMLQLFDDQRHQLQQDFFSAASSSGKPRGLRWKQCDWLPTWVLVRDAQTGLFTMFGGVNVSFEAIEGGDMEGVEAASMIRDATAVFHGQEGRWGTGGRVLFNMNPSTAAAHVAGGQEILQTSES